MKELPQDVQYIILSYLPLSDRIVYLKKKYSCKYCITKLTEFVSTDLRVMYKLYQCAKDSRDVLFKTPDFDLESYHDYLHFYDSLDKKLAMEKPDYYKSKYALSILISIKNYERSWFKQFHGPNVLNKLEKKIIKMFATIIMI